MEATLTDLFVSLYGIEPEVESLGASNGSARRYYRMKAEGISVIGAVGTDADENDSFIYLDRHFRSKGIPVPEVLAVSDDGMCYLQEDLGDLSLFDAVSVGREAGCYSDDEKRLLIETIQFLPKMQLEGAQGLDFSRCFPESSFNEQLAMFDLQYFKYCFLKPSGTEYRETALEEDFRRLASQLQDGVEAFMYRDFQARNVMVHDGKPYFIDFQGGRRGPLQYDLVSFVWQARSRFPRQMKEELVDAYLEALGKIVPVDRDAFLSKLSLFVLFRTLQVLAAYGFRGNYERKPHFLKSIPFALENLREVLSENDFKEFPYLVSVLKSMLEAYETKPQTVERLKIKETETNRLEVEVLSFSYKKGLPEDRSGNGGGYVFDCRAIHNPGRYEEYKSLTGMDPEVREFLEKDGEVLEYLSHIYPIIEHHVERYIKRGFTHLQISFGCTGGQHRSVYCAESVAKMVAEKYDVRVVLNHRERGVGKILKV